MKALLVYPEFPDTFWSFKHALQFINKKASNPPLGLATIAALLPPSWELKLVDLNTCALTQADLDWADLVMVSAMVVQRDSVSRLIARCKAAGKRVIAGGPLFSGEYDKFPQVDHFVLNEAEITLPLFLADFERGRPDRIYETQDYADMRTSPVPRWDLVEMEHYDSMAIQFSRGCPFNCDFCSVTALLGHQPRVKTAAQILAELDRIYELGWRRNIFFVDDNFIGNRRALKEEILPALIRWRQGKTGCSFITEASINLADDAELMRLMTAAGFNSVFVGIETPSEESLAECRKTQNKGRNLIESVKRLQRHGLQVMGGFIVGFDHDTPNIFQRQIEFIQNSGIVTAMVGLLQAPYGTQLYDRLQKEGRLVEDMSGDNTDGSTNIIPRMDPELLMSGYRELISTLYDPRVFYERVMTFLKEYHPIRASVHLEKQEIMAFFRSIYWLGIRGRERRYYWRLFFWSLLREPKKFALAITFSIYGFHFRKITEQLVS